MKLFFLPLVILQGTSSANVEAKRESEKKTLKNIVSSWFFLVVDFEVVC